MSQKIDYIPHEEMCRRILHCAIRMHFCLEDPLANHMIVQSLFRVLSDLYKKKFEIDIIDSYFKENFKPSCFNKKEFYDQFNKNYNKLKHAERDKFGPQRIEYYNANTLNIMICIYGYHEVFEKVSMHQIYFLIYQASFLQTSLNLVGFEGDLPDINIIVEAIRAARRQHGDHVAWEALSTQFHKQPEIMTEIDTDRAPSSSA